ncbi:MAG: DinB family protein [Chitinophagaceae bacterium]
MKKCLFFASALLMFSFSTTTDNLTQKERDYASNYLKDSENAIIEAMNGLNAEQLKFKTGPDHWSVEECLKHIAATEQSLWGMAEGTIKGAANPAKRSEIKTSDDQLIKMIESRVEKAKAPDALKPENTKFTSAEDALVSFKSSREKLVEYVNKTNDDLRNHVATLPFGSFDSYQMLLFIGAHSNRHLAQIEEVKSHPTFPKK